MLRFFHYYFYNCNFYYYIKPYIIHLSSCKVFIKLNIDIETVFINIITLILI